MPQLPRGCNDGYLQLQFPGHPCRIRYRSFNVTCDQLVFENTSLASQLVVYETLVAGVKSLVLGLSEPPGQTAGLLPSDPDFPPLLGKSITIKNMTLKHVKARTDPPATPNIVFLSGGLLIVGDETTWTTVDDGDNNRVGSAIKVETVANAAVGGTDLVMTSVSYTLTANVENLTLNDQPLLQPTSKVNCIDGTGNTLANIIVGNSGCNTIDGAAGSDTMIGGSGDDVYVVDNAGDRVIEASNTNNPANDGEDYILIDWVDEVRSFVSYTLPNFVENLQLMGSGNLNWTGNALANTIWANRGNNRFDGGAGALADTVSYEFGARSGVTIDLHRTDGQATGGSGTDTLVGFENVIGSAFDDTLIGTTGNNRLDGRAGADTVSYDYTYPAALTIGAGVVVNLTLNNKAQNTGASGFDTLIGIENLTGSKFDDTLTGNSGANVLVGLAGADTLSGSAGADVIKFVTVTQGVDVITDFASGSDKIQVVSANFGGLPAGALAASRFKAAGVALTSASAVFIYNSTTGALSFDGDGNGRGVSVHLATLMGPKKLVAGDIQVVAA